MKKSNIVLGLTALAVLAGCGPKNTTEVEKERQEIVETTVLHESEISRVLKFSTTLEGYQTMSVAPSVTGKIEHIYAEVGTAVQKGTLLVRMDQNQLNTTKLTYANLGVELSRLEALRESGSVSQQTYDQTKLSYDQTKENLDFLEANTFFKAPFSGYISAKNYEDGELYSGQPILTLTQVSTLKALVNIPEGYYPLVKAGMKVDIMSDIYPDETFSSTIETVYPTVDASSHTFQVKLRIPNSSMRLRPGMYAHTSLPMGNANAIIAPYQAVLKLTGANDRYVFVDEGGVAKRVFVKLGDRFDDKIEIVSDEIKDGVKIVTVGQGKLVDGSKLNVVKEN